MQNARRRALNRFLTQNGNLWVEETSIDALGGQVPTPVSVMANVRCRVMRASAGDLARAGLVGSQETITEFYKIAFEQGTPVGVNQKFTTNGVTYDLISVTTDRTDGVDEQAIATRRI